MADNLVVYQMCQACHGTGEPRNEEPGGVCGFCKGTGKILWGWMEEESL